MEYSVFWANIVDIVMCINILFAFLKGFKQTKAGWKLIRFVHIQHH